MTVTGVFYSSADEDGTISDSFSEVSGGFDCLAPDEVGHDSLRSSSGGSRSLRRSVDGSVSTRGGGTVKRVSESEVLRGQRPNTLPTPAYSFPTVILVLFLIGICLSRGEME